MQINTNNNTNFTGTFILKPVDSGTKDAVKNIVNKGRQIFYNIKDEGDVVIVTRDKFDKKIRDFIESSNTKFIYYPEISTMSGLDDEIPSGLIRLLNVKNNCLIRSLNLLNRFLQNSNTHLSKQCEYLHEAMNTLRLNVGNSKIRIDNNGTFIIRDNAKNRTIKSTGFRNGAAYVHIIPDSIAQESKRFLIGKNGKEIIKEYNTPKEILDFYKTFKRLINAD